MARFVGGVPVDATMPGAVLVPVPGVVAVATLPTGVTAGDVLGADCTVSIVLLLPIVECCTGIFAALGGRTGAYTPAAFVVGVAGAAGAGEEIAAPMDTGFPIPAMVGVPGTPVPSTGEVGSA